jgi:hypothetical protein
MTGQLHGFRAGGNARSGKQPVRGDAGAKRRLEDLPALGHREGIGLAGGAEERDTVAPLAEEAMAMLGEQREIRREIGIERRCGGAIDA